jgi:hypothetical protein
MATLDTAQAKRGDGLLVGFWILPYLIATATLKEEGHAEPKSPGD